MNSESVERWSHLLLRKRERLAAQVRLRGDCCNDQIRANRWSAGTFAPVGAGLLAYLAI